MLINYENVDIRQGDNLVLSNVNFHLSEGEMVYLIGKVGSGKSSLLKSLYCELDLPQKEEQTATVLERDLTKIKRKDVPSLRREMGIIFQDFQLLSDRTVEANLLFVLSATGWKDKKEMEERLEETLQAVGMSHKRKNMPHELSGGEQQRIAIARALLNDPKIIIADEPTGNLDPDTAHNIVQLLKDITTRGTAVLMSTHNLSLLDKFPGVVYRCEEGTLHEVTKHFHQPKPHAEQAED